MITEDRTAGNAYTEDVDYYNQLFGPPRQAIVYDWTIRRWCMVTLQPIATPRDCIVTSDPDKQMETEEWDCESGKQSVHAAIEAIRRNKAERDEKLSVDIAAMIRQSGPLSARALSKKLKVADSRVRLILKYSPDVFFLLDEERNKWGLVEGQG